MASVRSRTWRGCYPMTPDGIPIIDRAPGMPEETHHCFRSFDRDFYAAKKEALKSTTSMT